VETTISDVTIPSLLKPEVAVTKTITKLPFSARHSQVKPEQLLNTVMTCWRCHCPRSLTLKGISQMNQI